MMADYDVKAAFNYLRPITVLITQRHDVQSIEALTKVFEDKVFSKEILQEMHEYIAFPLRLVLKNYASKDSLVCSAALNCLCTLLHHINLQSNAICLDLFKTVLDLIFLPTKRNSVPGEELKCCAVDTFTVIFSQCDISCYNFVIKEALPLFGGLISMLLSTASESHSDLALSSIQCLHILIKDRHDADLRRVLFTILPSFLPGVIKHITKIITGHSPRAKVIVSSLQLMYKAMTVTLSDSPWGTEEAIVALPNSYFNVDTNVFSIVVKTEEWYKMATNSLALIITNIADICMSHSNWLVRREAVNWAYHILVYCSRHLPDSKQVLLDVITHSVGDDFGQVSKCSKERLRQVFENLEGIKDTFEMRVYDIATKLPTKVTKHDETGSLKLLKIFNGYLSSLDTEIVCLLRCHSHLQRISLALCQLLELDCSVVNILEATTATEHQLLYSQATFPVLRRQFTSFTDKAVWREIQNCIFYFTEHGELYPLVGHFMSECQTNRQHRLQCTLILNEILNCLSKSECEISSEEHDACSSVLELYCDMCRQLQYDVSAQSNITQRNESTQLHCLLLEGLVAVHQVTGDSYPELLLHSLYLMLESCAHDNILIKQTAVTGLDIISKSFHYSGKAELIEKHCNYVCNILSLNIRRLHRHPSSPSVLCSVIRYSQSSILPYILQIVTEVLLSLDDNYVDSALSLLRVPQVLLRQLCVWFPTSAIRKPSVSQFSHHLGYDSALSKGEVSADSTVREESAEHTVRDVSAESTMRDMSARSAVREVSAGSTIGEVSAGSTVGEESAQLAAQQIADYVIDYYTTRMTAEGINILEEEETGEGQNGDDFLAEEVDELEQQEDVANKKLPSHLMLTKKVLDRCKHLISHPNAKVRLVTIEMVADACTVLSDFTDELLPSIHDVWAGLAKRFSDSEPLVVIKAIDCLSVLANLSKEFIRVRVGKEVLPSLVALLHSKASSSHKTGKAYRHTLDYKLQLVVLDIVGKLCVDLKLGFPVLDKVVGMCVSYLSGTQPPLFREVAASSLLKLAEEDADLVWYHLHNVISQEADVSPKQCTENATRLISQI